ncbi:MAG: OmpA family protein [Cytophagaceae bacterium]|nr:OmpA family protein [Cytophagaceae bacterium]
MRIELFFLRMAMYMAFPAWLSAQTTPIGQPISTATTEEFNPSLSANGRMMIFDQIYFNETQTQLQWSVQKGGGWSRPEALPGVNSELKTMVNGGAVLNNNGNQIWFHSGRAGGLGNLDIWFMEKNAAGSWMAPKNLAKPINSLSAEMDPYPSPDGRFLFFTRLGDKKNSKGVPCGVIMMAERQGKDGWKMPVALPAPINKGCECSARLLSDHKTLLFASEREGGAGGFDLYRSQWKEDGSWSEPESFTFFNTTEDERYVSVPAGGGIMFHGAVAKTGGRDIFRTKIPDALTPQKVMLLQGMVKHIATNTAVAPKVNVTALSANKAYTYYGAMDGTFTISLPVGEVYDVSVQAAAGNFCFQSFTYDLTNSNRFEEKSIELKLQPVKADVVFTARTISFKQNSDTLAPAAMPELNRLLMMLKANVTMSVEIAAHTDRDEKSSEPLPDYTRIEKDTLEMVVDSLGREISKLRITYGTDNTQAQAKAVAEWLHRKGIPYERLKPVGYGTSKPPITPPQDPAQLRRIEVKILNE